MPFITEEIFSILYSNYKELKSIHLEQWPLSYDNLSDDLGNQGKLAIEIIKILRNCKAKLQIPLNQEISRVVISTNLNLIDDMKKIKTDISNTIRINELEIIDNFDEKDQIRNPELKEIYKNLNLTLFFFT